MALSPADAGRGAGGLREEERSLEVVHPAITLNRTLALGAAWGVVAWSAYALVEYLVCSIWPLFTVDQAVFTPVNWRLTALLFNSYWILGGVSGGLFALLAARLLPEGPARNRLAGAFTLYAAFAIHLLTTNASGRVADSVLVLDLVLLAATAWLLLHPASRLAPWATMQPLVAACFLLGPGWASSELIGGSGSLRRRLGAAAMVLAAVAASRLLNRLPTWSASRQVALNLALLGGVIAASAALSGANRELPPTPRAPSTADPGLAPVILVSLDTTRAEHLSVYGYGRNTTPHLKDFARVATLYTDLVAASDMTLSSHGSMFTGVYPSFHGAHLSGANPISIHPLDTKLPTLAGLLAERGVFTAAVAANNAFLTREWGLSRGFQTFDVQIPVEVLSIERPYYLRNGIRKLLSWCMETMEFDALYRHAGEVNNDAIGILEHGTVRQRSFFLFLNYMDAHVPYVAPATAGSGLPDGAGMPSFEEYRALALKMLRDRTPLPPASRELLLDRYDAGIAAEDAAFQDVVEWLKRRGLYDRSLIIVTSDHGEAFGEHGLVSHSVGGYQHQIHVPLIIKYPHQTEGAVVNDPVSHVDLMPTILDTLGMPVPAHVQGVSLRGRVAGQERALFSESFPARLVPVYIPRLDRIERTVRLGSLKLILSSNGKHEVFDLAGDPREQHNLTAAGTPQAARLESLLRDFTRQVPAPAGKSVKDEEQLRRLKGLGYVQ